MSKKNKKKNQKKINNTIVLDRVIWATFIVLCTLLLFIIADAKTIYELFL